MPKREQPSVSPCPSRPRRGYGRAATLLLALVMAAAAGMAGENSLRPASTRGRSGPAIPSTLIELDGSISSSPDGAELGYQWRQLSGPAVTLSDPTAAKPFFRTAEPGTYVFELVVTADDLASEPHIVQLEIEAENLPPVAKAPRELTGQVGKVLEVDGSDSFDPEGEELFYRWRSLSPGLELPPDESTSPVLTFEPAEEGVYELELVVFDGELKSDPAVCRLTIKPRPRPPVARARVVTREVPPDPIAPTLAGEALPGAGLAASINASADMSPAPPPAARSDTPVSELAAMAPPSFPSRPPATAAPSLPVLASIADIEASRPVARIEGPTAAQTGKPVVLDARASFNPSGSRLEYRWQQTAGALVENRENVYDGAAERFVAPHPGEYEFRLVVVDNGVESDPAVHRMRVDPAPEPPVAAIDAPSRAAKGELVRMNATSSFDPSGNRLVYRWRQTGGPAVRNYIIDERLGDAAPGFQPSAPGTYSFELIVSNGTLNSKPVEVDIVVADVAPTPGVTIAGPDSARAGDRIALDAVPHNVEGRTLSYLWQQVDGPAPALSQGGGMRTFVVPPVDGRYVFSLTAIENGQILAVAQRTIEIYGSPKGGSVAVPVHLPPTGRVPALTPLPNTPPPRPPPLESFPPARPLGNRPAQVMQR
ncbi:MAG: hypothetical protein LUE17_15595 [Planctomycetaceae bacterium]|nr:hypothetical protein [Planctomycetaceae bacterium]